MRGIADDELEAVDLNETVQAAVEVTRPRWRDAPAARGQATQVQLALSPGPPVRGTTSSLHDLVVNLLLNAVDAMPAGGLIRVATAFQSDCAQLTVADSGIGMSEELQERIFAPFFTTKAGQGTGLGLTTVHSTVTQWGGQIRVDSAPGRGSTFTIHLPLWTGVEAAPDAGTSSAAARVREARVAVVDDDQQTRTVVVLLLQPAHRVEAFASGAEFLRRFAPGDFDAVLIDLGMAGMPGDQLARELRGRDDAVATVLITGWELDPADARRAPFDLELQKPFGSLEALTRIVGQAVDLHDRRSRPR